MRYAKEPLIWRMQPSVKQQVVAVTCAANDRDLVCLGWRCSMQTLVASTVNRGWYLLTKVSLEAITVDDENFWNSLFLACFVLSFGQKLKFKNYPELWWVFHLTKDTNMSVLDAQQNWQMVGSIQNLYHRLTWDKKIWDQIKVLCCTVLCSQVMSNFHFSFHECLLFPWFWLHLHL